MFVTDIECGEYVDGYREQRERERRYSECSLGEGTPSMEIEYD